MPPTMPRVRIPLSLSHNSRAVISSTKSQWVAQRAYGVVVDGPVAQSSPATTFEKALAATAPRHNWTKQEIKEVYDTPLMKLCHAAVCSPSNNHPSPPTTADPHSRAPCTRSSTTRPKSRCARSSTSRPAAAARIAPTAHNPQSTIPASRPRK